MRHWAYEPINQEEEERPKVKVILELESGEIWTAMAVRAEVREEYPMPYRLWHTKVFEEMRGDPVCDIKLYLLGPMKMKQKERLTNAEILAMVEERLKEGYEETDTP